MKSYNCSSYNYLPLFQSSTLTIVEESPITHCWTSSPATSPCCTAGSLQLVLPSEKAALEHGLAPLAVGNGALAPTADQKRNRRVQRSRSPFGSYPSPWLKNAGTSRTDIITVFLPSLSIYIFIQNKCNYFTFIYVLQYEMCFPCQHTALG